MELMIREFDENEELLKDTEIDSFDKITKFCKESNSKIFEIHYIEHGTMSSARGVKKPNGHIDWKRIEN